MSSPAICPNFQLVTFPPANRWVNKLFSGESAFSLSNSLLIFLPQIIRDKIVICWKSISCAQLEIQGKCTGMVCHIVWQGLVSFNLFVKKDFGQQIAQSLLLSNLISLGLVRGNGKRSSQAARFPSMYSFLTIPFLPQLATLQYSRYVHLVFCSS